jgi:glycosyltransferase involved in cell wall biosynthesis
MTPAVTVLVTAFNRERYIGPALESVLAQTFQDFEVVVVDDCSSDRTVEIARAYAARDARVRIVVNPANLGDYPNRNHAATFARGRFLKYHDSDDVMYPHCLEVMVRMLEAEPRAAFALSSGRGWHGGPCPILSTPRMSYQREFLGMGMFIFGPAAALFRTDAFRALGGFENVGGPSDFVFWLRAAATVNILLVPGDLFWYRVHGGQELQSGKGRTEAAKVGARAWNALLSPECPLTPEERELAKRNRAFISAKECYNDLRAGRVRLALLRWRHAGLRLSDWFRYLRPPRRTILAGSPIDPQGEFVVPEIARAVARQ